MSRSHVKVKVIFQKFQEVYDFLLGVAGSEIPSQIDSISSLHLTFMTCSFESMRVCVTV